MTKRLRVLWGAEGPVTGGNDSGPDHRELTSGRTSIQRIQLFDDGLELAAHAFLGLVL